MPHGDKDLYLTFDDGPKPETTPRLLQMLAQYDARATFFCVGKNVEKYRGIYQQILDAGHSVGNHGYNHLKGWKTGNIVYLDDAEKCNKVVKSKLFRPPYGKMKRSQQKALRSKYSIIMWTVLSRDYDKSVYKHSCLLKTWRYTRPGAIVVFHDSMKSLQKLEYVLPAYLQMARNGGYNFKIIDYELLLMR